MAIILGIILIIYGFTSLDILIVHTFNILADNEGKASFYFQNIFKYKGIIEKILIIIINIIFFPSLVLSTIATSFYNLFH